MEEKTTWHGVFSGPCKAKKKSWFAKTFCEREIILRQNEKLRFVRVSPAFQILSCGFLAVFFVWVVFTSATYFAFSFVLENKDEQIASAEDSHRRLLAELEAYHLQIGKITSQLEKTPDFVAVPKDNKNKAVAEDKTDIKNRIGQLAESIAHSKKTPENTQMLTRENLLREVSLLANKMEASLKDLNWVDLKDKDIEVELQKIALQRDIALAETNDLRSRVNDLERQVSDMQDVQYLVFERMSSLASGGVQTIENNLANIEDALASTGLSVDKLLSRNIKLRSESALNSAEGKGGPFIPLSSIDLKDEALNAKLLALNAKVDRWENLLDLQDQLPLGKPLDKIRVTSRYGARVDPFTGDTGIHDGLDLGGKRGDSIYATAPGKVLRAGNYGLYGKLVEVEHTLGFRTRYAHMDKVLVKKGDWVDTGDKIGLVGNTGRSTGNHLHYEVRINSRSVNPTTFMRTRKDVFKK